jgi:hypothetical protein
VQAPRQIPASLDRATFLSDLIQRAPTHGGNAGAPAILRMDTRRKRTIQDKIFNLLCDD